MKENGAFQRKSIEWECEHDQVFSNLFNLIMQLPILESNTLDKDEENIQRQDSDLNLIFKMIYTDNS
jgi:hypothetical protein